MARRQVLTHVHHVLPFRLVRIRDVRMHRFGGGLEVLHIATGVVEADQFQVQPDVIGLFGELIKQVVLIRIRTGMVEVVDVDGTETIGE